MNQYKRASHVQQIWLFLEAVLAILITTPSWGQSYLEPGDIETATATPPTLEQSPIEKRPHFSLADIPGCLPAAQSADCKGLSLVDQDPTTAEILKYFDLDEPTDFKSSGFALNQASCQYDPKTREEVKKSTLELEKIKNDIQRLEKKATDAEAHKALQNEQRKAKVITDRLGETFAKAKFSPAKIGAVAGGAAVVAALGMGIADAVNIKKNGGSDAEAAASVLSGFGIAGAIPAVLACKDCSDNEKAAAFFSGFLGIDLTTLIVCPGRHCPADNDLAEYKDNDKNDWSWRRIKKSCPIGTPVVGTIHSQWSLDIVCGGPVTQPPLHQYYYRDNGHNETRMNYSLDCEKGDYVAGISFGVAGNVYGIKSILCAIPKGGRLKGKCDYKDWRQACPAHQYIGGIHLQRHCRQAEYLGVFVNITGRNDDSVEYGDNIKGVSCCDY